MTNDEIRSLSPSDKPAATSVAEAFEMGQRDMLERAANLVQTFLDDGSLAVADDLRNLLEIRALAAREGE